MTPELPIDGARPAYDVCNPDRLPAERVAFVDVIHHQFLQAFGVALAEYLDMPVKAAPAGIDQLPVAEFLDRGADDACIMVFNLVSTRGQAWVGLSGRFVFHILDILLGAPQTTTAVARAAITEIERHVLHEFFDKLTATLVNAWASSGVVMQMVSIGSVTEVRQAADLDGTALVLNCSVTLQEVEETFRIAVPVLAIRLAALQYEQKAAAAVAGETAQRTALLEIVGTATMQVEAFLGGSLIRLGDLASMQPGQILMLTQPAGSQLECAVNGKTKFRGEWIELGDRHGLQVEELTESGAVEKR
jgi:flagellar motor switch protein FliM